MIRIEYSIDGHNFNHVSKDFQDEKHAIEYIKEKQIGEFSSQIRLLVVSEIKNDFGDLN